MQIIHIALPILALLVLPACGPKKKSKAKSPMGVQFFVHGDPKQMIAGSTADQTSVLTRENIGSFNNFHLSTAYAFVEKEELVNPTGWDQVEDQNSTDSKEDEGQAQDVFAFTSYSFEEQGSNRIAFLPNAGKGQSFGFDVDASGRLNLTDVDGFPLSPIHYSLKNDGKAFSVLASYVDPMYGKGLYEIVFSDSSVMRLTQLAAKDYAFLFDNVKLKWDEEISVDLCGNYTELQKQSVQKSVEAWFVDPLKLGTDSFKPVVLGFKKDYKPFSDLNEHCVHLVSKFKLENSTNFYTAGVTLPTFNLAAKTQIDSDVFIFMDHVAREMNGKESKTTTHEMGHFFGLGHEFKEDEKGGPLYPSIMGYSQASSTVSKRDFEAIQALYGENLGLALDSTLQ